MVKFISTLLVAATLAVASFTTAAPVKKVNATAEPKVKAASADFNGKATWCKFFISFLQVDTQCYYFQKPESTKLTRHYSQPSFQLVTDSYGACNYHWNGYEENIVALNAHQMGPESWGNSECNRRVQIKNKANGKTVQARIVDKCPGDQCAWGSLDLSPKAFETIGNLDTGILDIEWYYI